MSKRNPVKKTEFVKRKIYKGKKPMKKENKGFTLIELMVTIAIMAIFSGVVLTTIGTGANSYRNTSSNAKAQMETQEAMDQIQNMIIDVNRSIYYSYGDGINGNIDKEISNDIDAEFDSATKTFFACSATEKNASVKEYTYSLDEIEWDSEEQKLYYSCKTWTGVETEKTEDESDNGTATGQTIQIAQSSVNGSNMLSTFKETDAGTNSDANSVETIVSKRTSDVTTKVDKTLLAENITDFRVDISKSTSSRIVRFQFTTDKNGKTITTIHTVNLRNSVLIQKPGADNGYTPDDEGDAWIAITHYPTEIKAGESGRGFSKTMNGNIDPSTVKWIVETSNAKFTGMGDSNLSLQVDENASGIVKIHIEAQTSDGKRIVSASVTINIITKTPLELISAKSEVLLGVGQSYEIHSLTTWTIKYNDGSKSDPVTGTGIWFTMPTISGVTLTDAGNLVVSQDIGKEESNSGFVVTANYWDGKTQKTLKGEFVVKLARIDFTEFSDTIYVGDSMPGAFVYRENGQEKQLTEKQRTISYSKPKATAENGLAGRKLTADDVGKWGVKVEVKLSDHFKNAYGTISAEKTFEVKKKPKQGTIKLEGNSDKSVVVAGHTYQCSYYVINDFHMVIPEKEFSYTYQIEWSVLGNSDDTTGFVDGNLVYGGDEDTKSKHLKIGDNEQGFILIANMKVYKGTTDVISNEYQASLNVGVIKEVKIKNTFEKQTDDSSSDFKVVKGRSYQVEAIVYVWRYDSSSGKHKKSRLDLEKDKVTWIGLEALDAFDSNTQTWTVPYSQTDLDLTCKLQSGMSNVSGVKDNELICTKHIIVEDTTTAQIVVENNQSSDSSEKTFILYLDLKNEKGPITDDIYANWSCSSADEGIIKSIQPNYQQNVYESGKEKKITLIVSSEVTATYRVTVSYKLHGVEQSQYVNITVIK